MITSSVDGVQLPLEIVHLNVFAPTAKPVKPEDGLPGDVMVPLPLTRLQLPVPTAGEFPANTVLEEQIV